MEKSYRHSAGFGRRIEYWLIGRMLREGLDVYVPLVDDFGIDAVVRKRDNQFIEDQIKARSADRGGSVCLNSSWCWYKWSPTGFRLPRSAGAR